MLTLGEPALVFVREQLELAAGEGFFGPLAGRLKALDLDAPFAFVLPEEDPPDNLAHGFVRGTQARSATATAVSAWLGRESAAGVRTLVLEESLGRWSDPWRLRYSIEHPGEPPHLGEKLYWTASAGDDAAEVERIFGRHSGYPGVGVLCAPPASRLSTGELEDRDLDAIATHAVAVLVAAFDDEAFVIAPVAHSSIRDELAA
jgi:hypothetical protein